MLIWLTFTAKSVGELNLIVSLFALVVITTFAFHKLIMESRIGLLEKEISILHQDKSYLEGKMKQMRKRGEECEELAEKWTKSLNNKRNFTLERRWDNERKRDTSVYSRK